MRLNIIFRKILTNSFGILFSRITGFIRDLLTASILGANIYSDIFFVAFKLPNLFRRIFAEGAFSQAFLPSFVSTKYKNSFGANVFIRFFIFIFIFSIFVTLFSPFFTKIIALGFDDELISLSAPFVAINFYYLNFIFIVSYFATLLQYKEHFATTAYSTALLNISLIISLLLTTNFPKQDIVFYMSIAVLVGGFLQVAIHIYIAKKLNILNRFLVALRYINHKKQRLNKDLKQFYDNFLSAIIGNSTAQISAFLDTWLASFLSAGAISYLYYANRVFQLPLALFAIATATALFPSISKMLKKDDEKGALRELKKIFWILFGVLFLSSFIGIFFSKEIVWLLFERGSFNKTDTQNTALILSMYLIGLIPYGISKLFLLYLYAKHQQKVVAKISIYSLVFNIILSLILIYFLKTAGLALASSITGFIYLFFIVKAFEDIMSLEKNTKNIKKSLKESLF